MEQQIDSDIKGKNGDSEGEYTEGVSESVRMSCFTWRDVPITINIEHWVMSTWRIEENLSAGDGSGGNGDGDGGDVDDTSDYNDDSDDDDDGGDDSEDCDVSEGCDDGDDDDYGDLGGVRGDLGGG